MGEDPLPSKGAGVSFKDLENGIRRRVEAAQAAARKIAERRAYKARRTELNKKKAARPPMYRPDAPPKYTKVVVLNVRKIRGPELGDLEEREYRVSTVS